MTSSASPAPPPHQSQTRDAASRAALAVCDFVLLAAAYAAASRIAGAPLSIGANLLLAAISAAAVALFSAYRAPFGIRGLRHVLQMAIGVTLGAEIGFGLARFFPVFAMGPGAYVLAPAVGLAAMIGVRRLTENMPARSFGGSKMDAAIVVGTGAEAEALVRSISQRTDVPYRIVGFVDEVAGSRKYVEGLPVLGTLDELPRLIARLGVTCVVVTTSAGDPAIFERIEAMCGNPAGAQESAAAIKIVPAAADIIAGRLVPPTNAEAQIIRYLRRNPIEIDQLVIAPHIENRTVLVTGAGGSIGAELCRQAVSYNPHEMILLGHGENSLFLIDQELREIHGFRRSRIVLADVADAARIRSVFSTYRPHIVFHAAAHKHVPILEDNVCEAVRNNVFGTHVVALAAAATGVAKFVMLSTDKAVNPTSILGATKRVAEIICQSFEARTGTEFVSVRFGNVLGSKGSVLEVFRRQIERGGPLTVTHPEMKRYFMTIPEAVMLVLEAMAIGRDGQVFVMDMGEPVEVVKIAEAMARLSGLRPYKDVDIQFTGIRPGEKLFEEFLTSDENITATMNQRLFSAQQERFDYELIAGVLRNLDVAVRTGETDVIIRALGELVPSFHPGEHLVGGHNGKPISVAPQGLPSNGAIEESESHTTGAITQ
jgi:FlaA1/EpsC-like NDP-sugar epimerase